MNSPRTQDQSRSHMDRIYHEWDKALSQNDAEALLRLYAPDAVIESPLIPHLLGKPEGVCRGHQEMRPFFELVAKRKPAPRQYYRTGYLSDGKNKMTFEYPRATPEGEQMDFVEVMELNGNGLIQHHKVYWGWRGFARLSARRIPPGRLSETPEGPPELVLLRTTPSRWFSL